MPQGATKVTRCDVTENVTREPASPARTGYARGVREKLRSDEVRRFGAAVPELLRLLETALNSVFDEQGHRWTELKLRVGAGMSAVELALHSRLQPRRALWHACMVLMSLKGAASGDDGRLLEQVADIAHTLSLVSIACDSETASEETVLQARGFLDALGDGEGLSWDTLVRANRAVGS